MPVFAFVGSLTRPAPNYRAANGRGLSTLRFDAATGRLDPVAELAGVDDAGWLTVDAEARRLYVACDVPDTKQSWIASLAIAGDGRLTLLNRQPTGGQTACHLSLTPDRRFLLAANYNAVVPAGAPDAAVAVFPVGPDGALQPAAATVQQQGSGPNRARQERSHAHCVVPSPNGRFVYVTDLGLDRIIAYRLGDAGELTPYPAADYALPPGSGPRHLVFQPDGTRLFVVSELVPTVLSLAVDPLSGVANRLDAFAIPRRGDAIVQPAGIVLSPDGSRLFVGLRECDEVLELSIDARTGRLSQASRQPSGGATPRDFALSPDGRHLVVANQDADRLTVFGLDGGRLGEPLQHLSIGTPMAVALATISA